MSDYLLITGMSGAGRSTTADALEDAGWYVIDNMPPSLLTEVVDVVGAPGSGQDRVALVIGRSGGTLAEYAVFRLPSVLVPLPTSADDHQLHNAKEFVEMGAATLVPEAEATPQALATAAVELEGWSSSSM